MSYKLNDQLIAEYRLANYTSRVQSVIKLDSMTLN